MNAIPDNASPVRKNLLLCYPSLGYGNISIEVFRGQRVQQLFAAFVYALAMRVVFFFWSSDHMYGMTWSFAAGNKTWGWLNVISEWQSWLFKIIADYYAFFYYLYYLDTSFFLVLGSLSPLEMTKGCKSPAVSSIDGQLRRRHRSERECMKISQDI